MRSNFRYEIDNKSLTRKHRRCSIELICGSAPYASNTPVSRPSPGAIAHAMRLHSHYSGLYTSLQKNH